MKKLFFSVLFHLIFISLWAQDVSIGNFKEYLPYNRFQSVAKDDENIYASTGNSILVIDQSDYSQEKWSNLNGLSDFGIQTIHNDKEGRLLIAYTNSNIDIIKDYKVYNIRDLLNKQITGSKVINNIYTFGDLAYFACDFGVVIIDLKTFLVKDSWFTIRNSVSYRALYLTIHNNNYYLATDNGVFSLPVTDINPADFSIWTPENELPKTSFKLLCSYQDKLFAVQEVASAADSLFVYKNSQWSYDNSMEIYRFGSFEVKDNKLLVCDWNRIKIFSGDSLIRQFYWQPTPPNTWQNGYEAIFDNNMNVWIADNGSGLIHVDLPNNKFNTITAKGPVNRNSYGLCFTDGMLAVVPGSRSGAIIPSYNAPAISILENDNWWSNINFRQFNRVAGFNSVAINPLNKNEIYIASWLEGLFKVNKATHEMVCYNHGNSLLKSSRTDSIVFISGLTIDKQNRLWMAHTDAITHPVKVKDLNTNEEKWYTPNLGSVIPTKSYVEHILIDSRNYKWITAPVDNKLIVFFENGSLENNALHKVSEVDLISQVNVAGSRITCIAEDREGRIWTGADQGVKVIYDAASVFNRKIYAKNILIEQIIKDTSYVQNLLEYEYITCIAVDAADRKWVGTRNAGIFFISPSGKEELFHFTTDNSPLFSNQINDIKINPENGEVFMATEGGLISYKGTATIGKEDYKEVLVYPNPVREDYHGPVAVKGLMEDSFCKITDARGNLVWQGYAYGGQLIWNGKDFYGKRPATGVYFVMASGKNGKERKVAKFLFIQ